MNTLVDAHPLLTQLVEKHNARWVDPETMPGWLQTQAGDQVLLFAGDPVRFPESLDVAVVLPELQKSLAAQQRHFSMAVAVPETARTLAERYGSNRWPTLMFFRDGQYVTTVSGMHDWTDYVDLMRQALDKPVGDAPFIRIPIVSAASSSHCH